MTQVRNRRPITPKQASARLGPIDGMLDPELFKALGDPTRITLLACLAKCGRPCAVGEIAQCCAVDLSVVSRHLRLLADAGVLDSSKSGRTVFYAVRAGPLAGALRRLADELERCCPVDRRASCSGGCCESC